MEALLSRFGHAVDNEILTITLSPPKNRIATLKVTNNITKEFLNKSISVYEQIGWYSLVQEIKELGWI